MKKTNVIVLALGFFVVGTTVYGQKTVVPNNICGDCGDDGGGGGGGGTTPPNYNLNWGSPSEAGGLPIGGVSGREGPAVGEFNNQVYVAYTSPTDTTNDGYNDNYVYIANLANGSFNRVNTLSGSTTSDANPALQYFSGNGKFYMAINSNEGNPARYNGGYTGLFRTSDGANWYLSNGQAGGANFPYVDYSPSMAASSQYLFVGYRNAADHTLTLCRVDVNENESCTNFPGSRAMNFNPSLAYYNGVLYIGYEEYDNTHALRMFTSTDNGQTIAENTNITTVNEDTTSTAPSLQVYNGALYVGFRTNDSDQKFLYRYSSDGINYSVSQGTGERMNSAPTLFSPTVSSNSWYGYMLNFYSSDDGNKWLTETVATHN